MQLRATSMRKCAPCILRDRGSLTSFTSANYLVQSVSKKCYHTVTNYSKSRWKESLDRFSAECVLRVQGAWIVLPIWVFFSIRWRHHTPSTSFHTFGVLTLSPRFTLSWWPLASVSTLDDTSPDVTFSRIPFKVPFFGENCFSHLYETVSSIQQYFWKESGTTL